MCRPRFCREKMISWGIIGCADIAKKFVKSIKLAENAKLVAVGSRTLEKVQLFSQETELSPDVQLYGTYQEVLDNPSVQAVYIPLPTTLHLEWVKRAAVAGKHILLEKPVALDANEFHLMITICREHNVFLMDGTMFMHHPRTIALQDTLRDPSAGMLRRVNTCFNFSTDEEFLRSNIRVKSDGDPLGVLGDLGWYCIRLGLVAFGRGSKIIPQPVKCSARCSKWTEHKVKLYPLTKSNPFRFLWKCGELFFFQKMNHKCSLSLPVSSCRYGLRVLNISAHYCSQSFEIHLLGVDSCHCDQIISCPDFVLPYSSQEAFFTRDISPLPGCCHFEHN